MRRVAILLMILGGAMIPASATAPQASVIVTDQAFMWSPANAPAGADVAFLWSDDNDAPHTVTSYRGQSFDSGVRASGSHRITFSGEETLYRCELHSSVDQTGRCEGMCGILVDDPTPPAPPAITTPAEGSSVPTSPVRVSGTADIDATIVEVQLMDHRWFTTSVEDGAWEMSLPLRNGDHELLAYAFDRHWNRSEAQTISFTVADTTAPAIPELLEPVDGSYVSSSVPILIATAEDAVEVVVTVGDQTSHLPVLDGRVATTVVAPPGATGVQVSATDVAGNLSEPASASVIVDDTPPAVVLQQPGTSSIVWRPLVISGRADDDHVVAEVFVRVIDRVRGTVQELPATCSGCGGAEATWQAAPELEPGVYTISATATDGARNQRESTRVTIVVV